MTLASVLYSLGFARGPVTDNPLIATFMFAFLAMSSLRKEGESRGKLTERRSNSHQYDFIIVGENENNNKDESPTVLAAVQLVSFSSQVECLVSCSLKIF